MHYLKRMIFLLFFLLAGVLLYTGESWTSVSLNAQSRERPPTRIDYSKFKHPSHAGAIKASRKGTVQQLDCAYCHGRLTKGNPDVVRGYPYRKYGLKNEPTHSACLDCHAISGSDASVTERTFPTMCLICHQNAIFTQMSRNLRPFPNPAAAESQFFDRYSHARHALYFEASDIFKERFKDKEKFKEEDNFECVACHTMNQANVVVAKIRFAPGVKESRPSHPQCFVCHFNENEVPKEEPTLFATNCTGCHAVRGEQTGKGSELAVHWFVRQIVNRDKILTRPGEDPTGPFSHKSHLVDDDDPSSKKCPDCQTRKCLECHTTAKKAEKRSDFFLESPETGEKQPRAAGCVQCHKINMEQKIEGEIKLEAAGCSYCHSLQTIKDRAAKGAQLPPLSHFSKKAP
jgi:hypothetical protein